MPINRTRIRRPAQTSISSEAVQLYRRAGELEANGRSSLSMRQRGHSRTRYGSYIPVTTIGIAPNLQRPVGDASASLLQAYHNRIPGAMRSSEDDGDHMQRVTYSPLIMLRMMAIDLSSEGQTR
jgi:hypothetical protein